MKRLKSFLILGVLLFVAVSCSDKDKNGPDRSIEITGLTQSDGLYGSIIIYDGSQVVGSNNLVYMADRYTFYSSIHKIQNGKLNLRLYDNYPDKNLTRWGTYDVQLTIGTDEYGIERFVYRADGVSFAETDVRLSLSQMSLVRVVDPERSIEISGLGQFNGLYGRITIYDGTTLVGSHDVVYDSDGKTYYSEEHKIENDRITLSLYDNYPDKSLTSWGTYDVVFTIGSSLYGDNKAVYRANNVSFARARVRLPLTQMTQGN